MVSMRGAAFTLGAVGLALFLAGILWALLSPPDASCPSDPSLKGAACERHNYGALLTKVMVAIGAGLLAEGAAVVLLLTHMSRRPPARLPAPKPASGAAAVRPTDAAASSPGAPRNRFLDPPVPGSRRPASPPNGRKP